MRTYSAANNAEEASKDARLVWLAHEQRASDKGERAPAYRDSAFVVVKISYVIGKARYVPDHGPAGKLWCARGLLHGEPLADICSWLQER